MAGKLYICATPIGNMEDITLRVLRTLKEADLIAAEDTRHTIKLLNHFDIKTPMTSYHEHNKVEKAEYLVERMREGTKVALVADAGTPAISDPGQELIRQCYEAGIEVTSLPGPSACVTALTLSGLPTERFCFEAFLPENRQKRQEALEELKKEMRTIIIYGAPHDMARTTDELFEALGDRRLSVCRELTKIHEDVWRTTLKEAAEYFGTEAARGEYVLVIEGADRAKIKAEAAGEWEKLTIREHVQLYVDEGADRKEAMRLAARDRGISRRDVYQELIDTEKD